MPLQVFYSLSERHMHLEFRPCDISHRGLPKILLDALLLMVTHADYLPSHREQARHLDTALLMVSRPRSRAVLGSCPRRRAWIVCSRFLPAPVKVFCALLVSCDSSLS